MGLFDFIKGQLIEVIEWVDDSRDTIVWKFPDQDRAIKMGAQLTVRESQVALFLNEGKLADVFQPGRHELTTRNLPLLTALNNWKMGFSSPFKADVYFLSTRQFANLKWGTPQPVMVSDPEFSLVQLRAFGTFSFRVKDAAQFFREFAGTDSEVTTDELLDHFRSRLVSEFAGALKTSGKSLQEINANAAALGEALLPKLQADFTAVGTELLRFNVEAVTLPDEIQKALTDQDLEVRKIRRAGAAQTEVDMQRKLQEQMLELQRLKQQAEMSQSMADMQKFLQFQSGVAMEYSGKNPSGEGNNLLTQMMQMSVGMNMAGQMQQQMSGANAGAAAGAKPMSKDEIMAALKEIGQLKEAGILTQDEFDAKKKELLARL